MPKILTFKHTVMLRDRWSRKEYPHTISGIRAIYDDDYSDWFRLLDQYPCEIILECDTEENHPFANGAELAACYTIIEDDNAPHYLTCGNVYGICPNPLDEGSFLEWRLDFEHGEDWLKTLTATFHIFVSNGRCVEKPTNFGTTPDTGWIHNMPWDFAAVGEPTFEQLEQEFIYRDVQKPPEERQIPEGGIVRCMDWHAHAGNRRKSRLDGTIIFAVPKPSEKVYRLYGDDRDLYEQVWLHHFWTEELPHDELIKRFCPEAHHVISVRFPETGTKTRTN